MAFTSRREMLFVYSVKDANPNGDPLNANHPRYDEETEQILVSDVRIKRTIRDQWLREGKMVFVDGEPKTLKDRFDELKKETQKSTGREVVSQCLDTRLFGVTFALGNKESFAWTGPVQFKWGRSLHAATVNFVQGTSAFATEGSGGGDKQQRSFRNEYKVPFAVIAVYGIANQFASERTGASDEDLDQIRGSLWEGTQNLITRSKNEHMARLYLEVIYKPSFTGKIGAMDEKIRLLSNKGEPVDQDKGRALRGIQDCRIDVAPMADCLGKLKEHIKTIVVKKDIDTVVEGLDKLRNMGFDIKEV